MIRGSWEFCGKPFAPPDYVEIFFCTHRSKSDNPKTNLLCKSTGCLTGAENVLGSQTEIIMSPEKQFEEKRHKISILTNWLISQLPVV